MHIKKDDMVAVMAGADKGKQARVLRVDRKVGKVVVEGVNRVYRHVRRSQRNTQGGRLSKEMPVDISNLALICTSCGKPTRTGARATANGGKERYCKKCNAGIGRLSPGKAAAGKK
jgi:large subunit ribosomal protein L24